MSAVDWQSERRKFEGNVAARSIEPYRVISNPTGSILITRATLEPFEGDFSIAPGLVLSLCLEGSGRFLRAGDAGRVDGMFVPGTFGVALPGVKASGFTPRADMLGLRIGMPEVSALGLDLGEQNFAAAAGMLKNDPLVSAVMRAIWLDAEAHGSASLFFQQGIALILRRLAAYQNAEPEGKTVRPLSGPRLAQVLDLIESGIGRDINISDLAVEARQDVRTFTRAFRAATGLAPYAYLTLRRMERAKQLLLTSQSVTAIAVSMGYANPSKFSAAFRRLYGCSPREWRSRNR
ncbi:MAG: AraC family transcriptional regulator [Bradyrhizobium sp.]